MRILGVPWEAVREAGRLDGVHAGLRAERAVEEAAGKAGAGRKERSGPGCRVAVGALLGPLVAAAWAAPVLLPWLMVAEPAVPAGPLRKFLWIAIPACAVASLPLLRARDAGKLDPFLALRVPSREALLLHRLSRLAKRTLLACLGWGAAVAIALRGAEAPMATAASLALGAALLPSAVVVRVAWGKLEDEKTERALATTEIRMAALGLFITGLLPWLLAGLYRGGFDRTIYVKLLLVLIGPAALWTNGREVAGRLRAGTMPAGAWPRALHGGAVFLLLLGLVAGAFLCVAAPGEILALLGPSAPVVGGGAVLLLALQTRHFLKDGLQTFAGREVLPKGWGERVGGRPPTDPAAWTRPFPPPERSLEAARMRNKLSAFSRSEVLLLVVVLAGFGLLIGASLAHGGAWYLLTACLLLLRWESLEGQGRAWLLGMDLRRQRRHAWRMGLLWQGPLLLALTALAIPFAGGGEDRWALLPFYAGVLLLRTGIDGWEGVLGRFGVVSLRSRLPLYVLLVAVMLAPMGGAPWSLAAAGLSSVLGLAGLLLEERLVTEAWLRERMLDEAERP